MSPSEPPYPRDLLGYGRTPPDPRWPGDARIAVQFTADIAAVTRDKDGTVVAGSLDDAVESRDIWTFVRSVDAAGPDWLLEETDEAKRAQMLKAMNREILEKAPHIWLPTAHLYTAWWPWVKNYNGELRAGGDRPGPIHARIWVDQAMKKKLGF